MFKTFFRQKQENKAIKDKTAKENIIKSVRIRFRLEKENDATKDK